MARLTLDARRALLPAAGLPLLYFAFAHACLAVAFAALAFRPSVSGGYFFHPKMAALVHLVTLGWISGSILGAFYIVGPLALRIPLRPAWRDRLAFASFAIGVAGITERFWAGDYARVVTFSVPVIAALLHVALRGWRGLAGARVPGTIKLHVALAFANVIAAAVLGAVAGANRVSGWLPWPPMQTAWAHAHVAAVGWAVMMVVGIGYRLVPMVLPAAMPEGPSLAASAVLLQLGVVALAGALWGGPAWSAAGALLAAAGLAVFISRLAGMLKRRLPPPAALPRPDWATRQTRAAFVMLLLTVATGLLLMVPALARWQTRLGWMYGVLGLVGFLSQIVVGIQGRLLPLHGWYRSFEARGLQPPPRSAHELANASLVRAIFLLWLAGVPALAAGLAWAVAPVTAAGAAMLFAGTVLNAAHGAYILARVDSA